MITFPLHQVALGWAIIGFMAFCASAEKRNLRLFAKSLLLGPFMGGEIIVQILEKLWED